MQLAEHSKAIKGTPNLEAVRQFLANGLGHQWFVQVEHSDEVSQHDHHWRPWNSYHVTSQDPQALLDDILTCHASHPQHLIRLHAQRSQPHTRMVYWVNLHSKGKIEQRNDDLNDGRKVLVFKQKTLGLIMLAGVVLASYFLIDAALMTV